MGYTKRTAGGMTLQITQHGWKAEVPLSSDVHFEQTEYITSRKSAKKDRKVSKKLWHWIHEGARSTEGCKTLNEVVDDFRSHRGLPLVEKKS